MLVPEECNELGVATYFCVGNLRQVSEFT
jgi:hypothetical protein